MTYISPTGPTARRRQQQLRKLWSGISTIVLGLVLMATVGFAVVLLVTPALPVILPPADQYNRAATPRPTNPPPRTYAGDTFHGHRK